MDSEREIRQAAIARGFRTKNNNLAVAFLCGSFLAFISIRLFPHSFTGALAGFLAGLLYANAFEYCLHRFLLHSGRGIFCRHHMLHHTTMNSAECARYVNFSRNPLGVVALFFANAVPLLVLEWAMHSGWAAGMFASFAVYYMAFEEIHWRTHMGGWLPKWLRPAAKHHLLHHADDHGRFNVFLPVFDWLLGPAVESHRSGRPHRGLASRSRLS